jgi:hypothetical protein
VTPPDNWRDRAACASSPIPHRLWVNPGRHNDTLIAQAKATCQTCPVLNECRDDMEAHGDFVGIRAGELWAWGVPLNATGTGAMR